LQIKKFIDWIKTKLQKKITKGIKQKKITKGINIGIEIEYEGCNCQHLEKELLRLGAVSFDSGWDGSTKKGHEEGARLRENRLRLESWKSLPALFYLLEKMIEGGCAITNKSGMHYHVDLRHENRFAKFTNRKNEGINELAGEAYANLKKIYELETSSSFVQYFNEKIKMQREFTTAEWRMGSQTLNYKKITLQIFAAIHITDTMTQNRKPNEKYIQMLAECCVPRF